MRFAVPTSGYLFLITFSLDVALGAQWNFRASSAKPKEFQEFPEVEPKPSTFRSKQNHQVAKTEELATSCAKERDFEQALDKLAYAFFVNPPAHESFDINYVQQMLTATVDGVTVGATASDPTSGPLKAAAVRLQSWLSALLRNLEHETFSTDDKAKRKIGEAAPLQPLGAKVTKNGEVAPLQPLGTKVNLTTHSKAGNKTVADGHSKGEDKTKDHAKGDHEINDMEKDKNAKDAKQPGKVLPAACPHSLPANDPYWSQVDSYWVCNGDDCDAYNECRYSDGCKKTFTNGERVASLRNSIRATQSFLSAYGVTHMLFGGSVIGAYRCQDVLPWDLDADVAVLWDDFPKIMQLLEGAPNGTGYLHKGRSVDMAAHGYPGFTLMEKYPGCMPLVMVDQSTGFFVDMFPMQRVFSLMYSPWWNGKVVCNSQSLFGGCTNGRCDAWDMDVTLPVSQCQIHTSPQFCAHNLHAFLHQYYGAGVEHPDRPTRHGAAVLMGEVARVNSAPTNSSIVTQSLGIYGIDRVELYLILTALVFVIPLLMWLLGVPRVTIVFTFYLGLYMAWAMLTYATRNGTHTSGMLVLNALLIKLFVSFVLWRLWEGSSYLELPRVAWEAREPLLQYAVPAGLYAFSDIIRTDALRATDASTFAILFNSRMLFLAFLWQWFMNRRLHLIHWVSLIAVLVGCCLKELPHIETGSGAEANKRHWAYAEIALLGVITCFATVWNEMLLQKRADVGVSLQNLAMYMWGLICTMCVLLVWTFLDPSQLINPFHVEAWISIWGHPLVLASAFVLAIYGVATAYFLRYLSNITREITLGAFAPLLSVAMDFLLFKLTMVPIEYAGLVLVLAGVILFAFKPVLAIDAAENEANKKPDASEEVAEKKTDP